jgi:hypothetical protein
MCDVPDAVDVQDVDQAFQIGSPRRISSLTPVALNRFPDPIFARLRKLALPQSLLVTQSVQIAPGDYKLPHSGNGKQDRYARD